MRGSIAALVAAMWAVAPAAGQQVTGPVPVTPDSAIFGASSVPGAALSIDLTRAGYVEEEYFVRGSANAYRRGGAKLEVLARDLPYVTRIIVRRPRDAQRFSGVVHFEPLHPSQGGNSHWLATGSAMIASGDAYVAASLGDDAPSRAISLTGPVPTAQSQVLKWFDPVRYAALAWPDEDGIRYDVMAQIGALLRGAAPDNPLKGYRIRRLIVGGWSFTGSVQRTFINEGFHDRARLPGGRPVFDGYLIGISSRWNGGGYVPLNAAEPTVVTDDPRRSLKPIDVPVIEFLSEFESATGPGPQRPDSDAGVGRHRIYTLGGTIHGSSLVGANLPRTARPNVAQLAAKAYPVDAVSGEAAATRCPLPISDLPHAEIARAVLVNLVRWADGGPPPPHAAPLTLSRDGSVARDAAGNPLGGIRVAEFDQPIARYGLYTGTAHPACIATTGRPIFIREDLAPADLQHRYGTVSAYLVRYDAATDALVRQRWLLPADAAALKATTRRQAARAFAMGK